MEAVAAVAACAQLLSQAINTTETITIFCNRIKDSPAELSRLRNEVIFTQQTIVEFRRSFDSADNARASEELGRLVRLKLRDVNDTLDEMCHNCSRWSSGGKPTLKTKIKLAFLSSEIAKMLERLRDIRNDLMWLALQLNLRLSWMTYETSISAPSKHQCDIPRTSRKVSVCSYVPRADAWLRALGFYWTVTFTKTSDGAKKTQVLLGFKTPHCVPWKSLSVLLQYSHFLNGTGKFIQEIRVQNQLPKDSPFMLACARGDMPFVRQSLEQDESLIRSRTTCTGKTPLLLAISSKDVETVKCLLEFRADPNMGDDESLLPVFATLGFCTQTTLRRKRFAQYPPQSSVWLEILSLLLQSGASIHESVYGRTVTMANFNHSRNTTWSRLRFLRLLRDQHYVDFDMIDQHGYSALHLAITAGDESEACIDFLTQNGVDVKILWPDGRSALHIAANEAYSVRTVRCLFEKYGVTDINRQDQWGWTPLHYAIDSPTNRRKDGSCEKVRYLLTKGASPFKVGEVHRFPRLHVSNMFDKPMKPFELASFLGEDVREKLSRDMESVGITPIESEDSDDDEEFFDADE